MLVEELRIALFLERTFEGDHTYVKKPLLFEHTYVNIEKLLFNLDFIIMLMLFCSRAYLL